MVIACLQILRLEWLVCRNVTGFKGTRLDLGDLVEVGLLRGCGVVILGLPVIEVCLEVFVL